MKERRKEKRWLLSKYFEATQESQDNSAGYIVDISTGGLLLMGKFPVQTNIVMPLKINLDRDVSADGELRVMTQVVHCGKEKDFQSYSTGCKLIDMTNNSRETIERIIDLYGID